MPYSAPSGARSRLSGDSSRPLLSSPPAIGTSAISLKLDNQSSSTSLPSSSSPSPHSSLRRSPPPSVDPSPPIADHYRRSRSHSFNTHQSFPSPSSPPLNSDPVELNLFRVTHPSPSPPATPPLHRPFKGTRFSEQVENRASDFGLDFGESSSPLRGEGVGWDAKMKGRPASVMSSETSDDLEDERLHDWSEEDDLDQEEAHFEDEIGIGGKRKRWGFKRCMHLIFSSFIGSHVLAALLAAPPVLVLLIWERPHPSEHRSFVLDNVSAWLYWLALGSIVTWWIALIVDLLPLIIVGLVSIVWGEVTEKLKMHLESYGVVRDWIKPIFYGAWAWGSWVVMFESIYHLYSSDGDLPSRARYTPRVRQVIELLFFVVLIYSIEKVLLQFIALSFHRVAFRDRLKDIEFKTSVLDRLNFYRPSQPVAPQLFDDDPLIPAVPMAAQPSSSFFSRVFGWFGFHPTHHPVDSHHHTSSSSQLSDTLPTFSPPEPAFTPPSQTEELDESDKRSHTKFGKVLRGLKVKVGRFNKQKTVVLDVASAKAARHLAKALYVAYRRDKRLYLDESDFRCAFQTEDETKKAFAVFDKDGNGDISKSEIKALVLSIYRERRTLARSMQDVDQATTSLNAMFLLLGAVILVFIALAVFGIQIGTQITSLYTLILGLSFVFKSAASNAFDSVIFIFVSHPFDTGDRVFIGEENFVVKKMRIFSTLFKRLDGTEAFYANSVLSTLQIRNVRRSGDMTEGLTVNVGWGTPQSKLDELEKLVCNWLATDEKRDLDSSTSITVNSIDFQTSIECIFGIPHLGTWQDWPARCARRTRFSAAVKHYMEQLHITCLNSSQPLRFVSSPLDIITQARAPLPSPLPSIPTSPSEKRLSRSRSLRRTAATHGHQREPSSPPNDGPTHFCHTGIHQTLGFLPPPNERGSKTTIRRRKTQSRRKILGMAGVGAGGD